MCTQKMVNVVEEESATDEETGDISNEDFLELSKFRNQLIQSKKHFEFT